MTTAYPYISTPALILHSSTDWTVRYFTVLFTVYCVLCTAPARYCYEDTPEFWARWRAELAGVAREITAASPDQFGVWLLNCAFHGAVWYR